MLTAGTMAGLNQRVQRTSDKRPLKFPTGYPRSATFDSMSIGERVCVLDLDCSGQQQRISHYPPVQTT